MQNRTSLIHGVSPTKPIHPIQLRSPARRCLFLWEQGRGGKVLSITFVTDDEVTESCGTHVGCIESLANAQCREINIMRECGNRLFKLYVSVKKLSFLPFPVSSAQHEWLSSA